MTEQHQGLGAAIISNMGRFAPNFLPLPAIICANVLAHSRYQRTVAAYHLAGTEAAHKLVLEKPTILVAEDLTPSQF